jgi:hypothetical protein
MEIWDYIQGEYTREAGERASVPIGSPWDKIRLLGSLSYCHLLVCSVAVRALWSFCPTIRQLELKPTWNWGTLLHFPPASTIIQNIWLLGLSLVFKLVSCSAYSTRRWRQYVLFKRRLTSNKLHGIIYQKIVIFIRKVRFCRGEEIQIIQLQYNFHSQTRNWFLSVIISI